MEVNILKKISCIPALKHANMFFGRTLSVSVLCKKKQIKNREVDRQRSKQTNNQKTNEQTNNILSEKIQKVASI